jgi:hypothetical protein
MINKVIIHKTLDCSDPRNPRHKYTFVNASDDGGPPAILTSFIGLTDECLDFEGALKRCSVDIFWNIEV